MNNVDEMCGNQTKPTRQVHDSIAARRCTDGAIAALDLLQRSAAGGAPELLRIRGILSGSILDVTGRLALAAKNGY